MTNMEKDEVVAEYGFNLPKDTEEGQARCAQKNFNYLKHLLKGEKNESLHND